MSERGTAGWERFRALSWEPGRTCCVWVAVTPRERLQVYREHIDERAPGVAAHEVLKLTAEGERISRNWTHAAAYDACGEMWRRHGLAVRVQESAESDAPWEALAQAMVPVDDLDDDGHWVTLPRIVVVKDCRRAVDALTTIGRSNGKPVGDVLTARALAIAVLARSRTTLPNRTREEEAERVRLERLRKEFGVDLGAKERVLPKRRRKLY